MPSSQNSARGNGEKKITTSAKTLAKAQTVDYFGEMRSIRNKVRGAMENADLSDPETVALLKATARMWNVQIPHA
jgi:hypothetical protein